MTTVLKTNHRTPGQGYAEIQDLLSGARADRFNRAEFPALYSVDLRARLRWGTSQVKRVQHLINKLGVDQDAWTTMNQSAEKAGWLVGQHITGQIRSRTRLKKSGKEPLWFLRYCELRWFKHPHLRARLERAIESNDEEFFTRFGEQLKRKPRSLLEIYKNGLSRLQQFLLVYWVRHDLLPLCLLSRPGLTEICRFALNQPSLSTATIDKTVKRLGLARFNGPRLAAVVVDGRIQISNFQGY